MSKQFFLFAFALLSLSATAQDTAAKTLDEVVITANKFENKTALTGKVVTVITRQDLERAGSKDLSQLLTEQGGVYLNGAFSNPGKDKSVYLRGAKVDHTLIAIDGVPVYDASGIGSNFDLRLIPIESVERVEILRGSQSTLYGSDAIAGVINIITKKGGGKPVGASGSVSYGSFNTLRTAATLHGVLKKLDYNIGANHFKTDGISEAEQPTIASSIYDQDGFTQNGLQAGIGIQATKSIRIQPYIRYSKISGDLDQQAFVDERDFTYAQKNVQTGVRNEFALGAAKLNVLYNYNGIDRDYLDDSTESRNGYYLFNKAVYKAAEHFAEAYVVYPFQKLKFTAGVDFRSSHTDYNAVTVSPSFNPAAPAPVKSTASQSGDSVHQKQVGFYSALHFSDAHFGAEVGSRFNHHSVYGTNVASNINAFYRNGPWKLFANVSSGYKTPSLYQLYSEYGNTSLKPESAINAEGGLQYFAENERATGRATYFYRDVTDVIFFFYNPATFQSQYINQDKQTDEGIELETKITITNGLDFKLFYSYTDGRITTKSNGKDTTYFNLIRRPKSSLTALLGYSFGPAYAGVQVSRFGKRSDIYFDPATFQRQDLTLKPYTLVNVYAEYEVLKKLKLFADLRNVAGEKYNEIYGYSAPRFNGYGGIRFQL
jgi:vitamin B12 transporter